MKNEWQPIETAPKDKSEFLMFVTGIEYKKYYENEEHIAKTIQAIVIASYNLVFDYFVGRNTDFTLNIYPDLNYKDVSNLRSDKYCKYDIQATHWMPLPKPPIINN